MSDGVVKPKRGRKPKNLLNESQSGIDNQSVPKKRGRKPKGGKIIDETFTNSLGNEETSANVILHLKCNLKDLNNSCKFEYTPNVEPIVAYDIDSLKSTLKYDNLPQQHNFKDTDFKETGFSTAAETPCEVQSSKRNVLSKLKALQSSIQCQDSLNKRCACFWCTYDFDNLPIHIPKHEIEGVYHVYGCFCSPECAVAHLITQNIDTSTKFERLHLLNNIYCKVYNYAKNIKPAPNPFYTLEKFYGNLSISEYRKLLEYDRILFVVDKPLSRSVPEIYEENDEHFVQSCQSNSSFKVRKKNSVKENKKHILSENFNIS